MIWHNHKVIHRNACVMPGDIQNSLPNNAAIGCQRNFVYVCHICGCVRPKEVFPGFCADGDEISVWGAVVIVWQTVWLSFRQVHRYHLSYIVSLPNMNCNSKYSGCKFNRISPQKRYKLGSPRRGVPSGARKRSGTERLVLRCGPNGQAMRFSLPLRPGRWRAANGRPYGGRGDFTVERAGFRCGGRASAWCHVLFCMISQK